MCFSATASFAAAAILAPSGLYGLKKAIKENSRYVMLAVVVIVFAFQQMLEGFVWLAYDPAVTGGGDTTVILATAFLFFSHFYWPVMMPVTVYFVEEDKKRKKVFLIVTALSFVFSLFLYFPMVFTPDGIGVKVIKHSIMYDMKVFYDNFISRTVTGFVYLSFIILPLIFSSDKNLKYFGCTIILAGIPTYFFYYHAFTSVWCFFAAIASIYIAYILSQSTVRQK